jgi:hypothetical protein
MGEDGVTEFHPVGTANLKSPAANVAGLSSACAMNADKQSNIQTRRARMA